MKKIFIIALSSLLLLSCGVKQDVTNTQKTPNTEKQMNSNEKKVETSDMTGSTKESTGVDEQNVELTPEDEKMINDLLNF